MNIEDVSYKIVYENHIYIGPEDRKFGLFPNNTYKLKLGYTDNWTPSGLPCIKVRELNDMEFVYASLNDFYDSWSKPLRDESKAQKKG